MAEPSDGAGRTLANAAQLGREFGEEVLEALIWDAVEDELRRIGPGARTDAFAAGLRAWGEELFARWTVEVAGYLEARAEAGSDDPSSGPSRPVRDAGTCVCQAGTSWLAAPNPGTEGLTRRTMPSRSISSCTTRALTTSSRSRVIVRAIQSM